MKINELISGQPGKVGKGAKGAGEAGSDFQQLLMGELRKTSGSPTVQAATNIASLSTVPASVRLDGLTLTEGTIDTLQSFAKALENTSLPVEALEPYVSSLEEGIVALLSVRNQLGSTDSLAQVLERVATVAYLESAKYRRGDYDS
jgi:hypothetical protein